MPVKSSKENQTSRPLAYLNAAATLATVLVVSHAAYQIINPTKIYAQADVTPPVTTATLSPTDPDGDNNWYVSPVDVSLSATDLESGVQSINYRIDGGSWQSVVFEDTLNLAPNPSFEIYDGTSSARVENWSATVEDVDTTYSQDTSQSLPGFGSASAKITTTGIGWHGINHAESFGVTTYLSNMVSSVWLKTENVTGNAYYKIYAVVDDGLGGQTYSLLGTSPALTGTNDWTELTLEFIANVENILGVYIDVGLDGSGTVWTDAVTLNESLTTVGTEFTVGADGEHTVEYYSVDRSGNIEAYTCTSPAQNCGTFKIDQTPPGNWHDSGAFRGIFGSSHELYVYTNVEDTMSGLSVFTDKYNYHTETQPGFGRYNNILSCGSTWQPDDWVILISPPFTPGANSAFLLTPKTDFCNSNWKICKIVMFHAEDRAGNVAEKGFCINGPWIQFGGEGIVRSNHNIDMLAEPYEDNTDGLIDIGGNTINFFSSSKDWEIVNDTATVTYDYSYFQDSVTQEPQNITELTSTSGVFVYEGDLELRNQTIPNDYDNNVFDQIVFVNGNLRISNDIQTADATTALFVVSGNVEISKTADLVQVAIVADGDFYTAYDVEEGQQTGTLTLEGIYSADKFIFSRTLQGTNNAHYPSEDFVYQPKYLLGLGGYLGSSSVQWVNIE